MAPTGGGTVVGMTAMPEAGIARELAMCFTSIALVTDLDAGVPGEAGVTQELVLDVLAQNVTRVKRLLTEAIAAMPPSEPDESATCPCRRSLDGLTLPFPLPN
jgi:5'-methylthioadenosine phosphorylase